MTGTSHRFERKVKDCVKDRDALYIPPDSLATAVSHDLPTLRAIDFVSFVAAGIESLIACRCRRYL